MAYKPTFHPMREVFLKEQREEQEMARMVRDSIQKMLSRPMFPKTERSEHEAIPAA